MRTRIAYGIALALLVSTSAAHADPQPLPPLPAADAPPAARPAPTPVSATTGIAVIGTPGAADLAWPLARSVYADMSLRPASLDEARARILCGEPPPAGAAPELTDLAETLAAIHGEDAASRAILGDIARRLGVRALVVVRPSTGTPGPRAVARVFVAETDAFDAATYSPDAGAALAWAGTTHSLARMFGSAAAEGPLPAPPSTYPAPALATHEEPPPPGPASNGKAFYESGWFWGAIGAAAFAGGAVYFATRDNSASTIHLEMQVPH